jgi:MFS family permease
VQWLLLLGSSFVVSAYLQVIRGYNAIQTGVIFTAATLGVLISSMAAERFAKRRSQRTLVVAGFAIAVVGIGVLLLLVVWKPSPWAFAPGLFLLGFGCGTMLTPSVNIVQSSWPERLQGEISGLSRAVSNLGSTFGTAIAGTVLVALVAEGKRAYGYAMIVLAVAAVAGLVASLFLPRHFEAVGVDTNAA